MLMLAWQYLGVCCSAETVKKAPNAMQKISDFCLPYHSATQICTGDSQDSHRSFCDLRFAVRGSPLLPSETSLCQLPLDPLHVCLHAPFEHSVQIVPVDSEVQYQKQQHSTTAEQEEDRRDAVVHVADRFRHTPLFVCAFCSKFVGLLGFGNA